MSLALFEPDPSAEEGWGEPKRFFERWLADPSFRQALALDAAAASSALGLRTDPAELRFMWDETYRKARYRPDMAHDAVVGNLAVEPPAARALIRWIIANNRYRERLRRESAPADVRFAAWRERQIARAGSEFRAAYDFNTPHTAFAIELSKGCSVGCWFCGVSAPKLDGHFLFTQSNRRFFRDVLDVLAGFTGTVAGRWGFLYWATDPFDNPDYERFCLEFHEAFGQFPVSTTAQPLKNVERTRAFIDLARRCGSDKIRFSVLSLPILTRIHDLFTAEELDIVDLIPLNEGALLRKAASGRARERFVRQAVDFASASDTSIACVSGFLLNLVDRSVKMITPCTSSERWPLGYRVHGERRFDSAAELHRCLEAMIEAEMPPAFPEDRPLRFRADLAFEDLGHGFALTTEHRRNAFEQNSVFRDLALLIRRRDRTVADVERHFLDQWMLPQDVSRQFVDLLFRAGLLDEEPAA